MPDLKAAAKLMRVALAEARSDQVILDVKADLDMATQIDSVCDSLSLAAQALEAWAWQQEKGGDVQYDIEDDSFVCDTFNGQYRRCTPLGAVLAAMEGERDA